MAFDMGDAGGRRRDIDLNQDVPFDDESVVSTDRLWTSSSRVGWHMEGHHSASSTFSQPQASHYTVLSPQPPAPPPQSSNHAALPSPPPPPPLQPFSYIAPLRPPQPFSYAPPPQPSSYTTPPQPSSYVAPPLPPQPSSYVAPPLPPQPSSYVVQRPPLPPQPSSCVVQRPPMPPQPSSYVVQRPPLPPQPFSYVAPPPPAQPSSYAAAPPAQPSSYAAAPPAQPSNYVAPPLQPQPSSYAASPPPLGCHGEAHGQRARRLDSMDLDSPPSQRRRFSDPNKPCPSSDTKPPHSFSGSQHEVSNEGSNNMEPSGSGAPPPVTTSAVPSSSTFKLNMTAGTNSTNGFRVVEASLKDAQGSTVFSIQFICSCGAKSKHTMKAITNRELQDNREVECRCRKKYIIKLMSDKFVLSCFAGKNKKNKIGYVTGSLASADDKIDDE